MKVLFNLNVSGDSINAQVNNSIEIIKRLSGKGLEIYYFSTDSPHELISCDARPILLHQHGVAAKMTLEVMKLRGGTIIYQPIYLHGKLVNFMQFWELMPKSICWIVPVEGTLDSIAPVITSGQLFKFLRLNPRSKLVSISPYITKQLRTIGLQSTEIPLGVDTRLIKPKSDKIRGDKVKIICAGSILPLKNQLLVMQLAKELKERAEIRIAGTVIDQTYYLSLKKFAEENKLKNVTFLGPISRFDLYREFAESDLNVLASRREGFPKVLLEAAAAGIPSVVFSDYQTLAVIDGITGFVAKSDREFIEKTIELVDDPNLRTSFGKKARQLALKYDWDVCAEKWYEIITNR